MYLGQRSDQPDRNKGKLGSFNYTCDDILRGINDLKGPQNPVIPVLDHMRELRSIKIEQFSGNVYRVHHCKRDGETGYVFLDEDQVELEARAAFLLGVECTVFGNPGFESYMNKILGYAREKSEKDREEGVV